MSNTVDMWSWLDDADRQVGDDGPGVNRLFNQLRKAMTSGNLEGIQTCRREYERLAAAHELPWLGVFGRHWEAQYRLNFLFEGASAVGDVVAAFEKAHRPETADCPQSICSVQDLAIVYGNVDGPGYAEATLAATKDAMARIDSSWPCWDCLSLETIDGLEHAGRHDEALELLTETEVELRSTGANPSTAYARHHLEQLLNVGRDEDALAFDEALVRSRYDSHDEDDWPLYEMHRGRALLRNGRTDEAVAILEGSANPVEWPRYALAWMSLTTELMTAGAIENDDYYSAMTVRIAQHFKSGGAWRRAFDTGIRAALAAAQRGAVGSAKRSRDFCAEVMENLVKPLDAPEKLASVDTAIANAPESISGTAPIDQQVAQFERMLAAEFNPETFAHYAELLRTQGWTELAGKKLWDYLVEHPDNVECCITLMTHLLGPDGDASGDRLLELANLVEETQSSNALWIRANRHARLEEWDDCGQACAEIVAQDPSVVNTRRLWAHAMRSVGNYPYAAELSAKILELGERLADEPPQLSAKPTKVEAEQAQAYRQRSSDLWAAMLNGTLGESWAVVRSAAAELEMELSSDSGPIEEQWEHCLVSFTDDDGVRRSQQAQRTGPVTARVAQVAFPRQVQRFGARIVFEPTPLNALPPDATEDERSRWMPDYPVVATVEPSNMISYAVEGVFPDDDDPAAWLEFRTALFDAGYPVWIYGAGTDTLRATGEERSVLLLAVAVDANAEPAALSELIAELTANWPHPLAWPALVEAAGGDRAEHDERLSSMWGSED